MPDRRPRLVVALGGGGCKSAAEIGVLRSLEKNHIRIDGIVGTSMGATIGALYCSGMSLDDIEKLFVDGSIPKAIAPRIRLKIAAQPLLKVPMPTLKELANRRTAAERTFEKKPAGRAVLICSTCTAVFVLILLTVLFVPPVRDRFFSVSLWPWQLPSEATAQQLKTARRLAKPGDVIIETNWHYWQWVGLSYVFTHSTWVHAALVDERGRLLTVAKKVSNLPFDTYLKWRSTRMALIRPPYKNAKQAERAIDYARSKLNMPYDPSFRYDHANCTGLVAESLRHAGIAVPGIKFFGRRIYSAESFLEIRGTRLIWSTDQGGANLQTRATNKNTP